MMMSNRLVAQLRRSFPPQPVHDRRQPPRAPLAGSPSGPWAWTKIPSQRAARRIDRSCGHAPDDPDGDPRPLHGAGEEGHRGEPVVLALEPERLAGLEAVEDREGLVEPLGPLPRRRRLADVAEARVIERPEPHREHEAAARQRVQRDGLAGELPRPAARRREPRSPRASRARVRIAIAASTIHGSYIGSAPIAIASNVNTPSQPASSASAARSAASRGSPHRDHDAVAHTEMIAGLASRRDDPRRRSPETCTGGSDARRRRGLHRGDPAVFVVLALRLGAWRTLVALIAVAHLVVLASVALFPLPVDPGLIAGGRAWAAGTAGESLNLVPFATIGPALAGVGGTGARVIALANLFVLAPAGVYLPILVPRLRGWRVFLPAALVIGGSIEAAQAAISFLLASGTATSTWTTGSSTPSASCSGSPRWWTASPWPAGARAAADFRTDGSTCRPARRDRAVGPATIGAELRDCPRSPVAIGREP